jgi:hypothetical protein
MNVTGAEPDAGISEGSQNVGSHDVRGLKIMRNAGETTHFHACVKENYVYVGKGHLNLQDLC